MKNIPVPDEYYEPFLCILDVGLQMLEPNRDKFDKLEEEVFQFCEERKWEVNEK